MSIKTNIVYVDGEAVIPIPEDIIKELKWKDTDNINTIVNEDGSLEVFLATDDEEPHPKKN